MQVNGECHCGQLRFRAEVDPARVIICHCTDCQTLSGSAYRTVASALPGSFEILAGTLKDYVKTAEDGALRVQTFCPDCGTPVYSAPPPGEAGYFGLRVGALKQRNELVPEHQIWARSAQVWTQSITDIPKTAKQ